MVNKLHIDPLGATRQLGKRGALKQATFLQLWERCGQVIHTYCPTILHTHWVKCLWVNESLGQVMWKPTVN